MPYPNLFPLHSHVKNWTLSTDITELAEHWRLHIEEWKSTKALPPNVTPTEQWEPTYPVVLTTRRCLGFIGVSAEN